MTKPKKQESKPDNVHDWIDQWPGGEELRQRREEADSAEEDAKRECKYGTYAIKNLMVGVDALREKVYETEAIWSCDCDPSDSDYKKVTGDFLESWRNVHQANADNLHNQAIEKCFEVVKLKKDWDEKKLTSSNIVSELIALRETAREAWDKEQEEKK